MERFGTGVRQIEKIALDLFDKFEPATLTKNDVEFFDKYANIIIDLSLPSPDKTAEAERRKRLKLKDKYEESEEQEEDVKDSEIELRRAIKTVEVIGCIIKNRAGSLEKIKLESIFKEAMNIHLRLLSSLFEIIKNEERQEDIIEGISKNLIETMEKNEGKMKELSNEELRKIAKHIFWNMNFILVASIIDKIVHSLGSDKLITITNNVCDEIDTPASFMVKQGILMWYKKNLQLREFQKRRKMNDFSNIARISTKLLIINYCSIHKIDYNDRQTLENLFGLRQKKLLTSPKR